MSVLVVLIHGTHDCVVSSVFISFGIPTLCMRANSFWLNKLFTSRFIIISYYRGGV